MLDGMKEGLIVDAGRVQVEVDQNHQDRRDLLLANSTTPCLAIKSLHKDTSVTGVVRKVCCRFCSVQTKE